MSDEAAGQDRLTLSPDARVIWETGASLPVFACLDGVEVAVIARANYHELVMLRAKHAMEKAREAVKAKRRITPAGLSTIERDAEVAEFLRERFRGRLTIQALHAACVEAFGEERAPSRGRIQVFRSRWREYK